MSHGECAVSLSEQPGWLHPHPGCFVLLYWLCKPEMCVGELSLVVLACNLIDVCLVICLRLNYSLSPLNKMLCMLLVGQHFAQCFPLLIPPTLMHSFGFAAVLVLRAERGFCWEKGETQWSLRGFVLWLFGSGKWDYFSSDLNFDVTQVHTTVNGSCYLRVNSIEMSQKWACENKICSLLPKDKRLK